MNNLIDEIREMIDLLRLLLNTTSKCERCSALIKEAVQNHNSKKMMNE